MAALGGPPPGVVLDLGSGGGVPGLVLADRWPEASFVLLDSQAKRTAFLAAAVRDLGWDGRVAVRTGRAEELGRDVALRSTAAAVVARSFGPPAVAAECGAPFLRAGGVLVVAEPPVDDPTRWPAAGLRRLGLVDDGIVRAGSGTVRRLVAGSPCPDEYPRPNGVPGKRPLF